MPSHLQVGIERWTDGELWQAACFYTGGLPSLQAFDGAPPGSEKYVLDQSVLKAPIAVTDRGPFFQGFLFYHEKDMEKDMDIVGHPSVLSLLVCHCRSDAAHPVSAFISPPGHTSVVHENVS